MHLESEGDFKPVPSHLSRGDVSSSRATASLRRSSQRNPHSLTTLHEHPTSGTVLSMIPSLFETSLGHGPTAGTIRTSPDGICLKTSTWLMLYAMPFSIALCFLAFVLGKVETMWSKISCLIGAAICYMVCWGLMVAIMNPDHEARVMLERLNQVQEEADPSTMQSDTSLSTMQDISFAHGSSDAPAEGASSHRGRTISSSDPSILVPSSSSSSSSSTSLVTLDTIATLSTSPEAREISWTTWVQHNYAQNIRTKASVLARILDDLPDTFF